MTNWCSWQDPKSGFATLKFVMFPTTE